VLTVLLVQSRDLECVLASLDDIVVEFVPLGIFKVNISSFDSGCKTARISGGINSEIIISIPASRLPVSGLGISRED